MTKIEVDTDVDLYSLGWDDGLPICPPTEEAVEAMCATVGIDSNQVVCELPPAHRLATAGAIAANAVMAGCRPEYFPVVLTSILAMTADEFNLNALQCTTHMVAPLTIVNGPIRNEIGLNSGPSVFGPGPRSNATIGRAIRLVMLNIGGARPGEMDRSTLGNPAKYTYCIAENEEASPWEPLHASRGLAATESAVTVIAAEPPHSITNHVSSAPEEILLSVASAMSTIACNNAYLLGEMVVVLGVEHAKAVGGKGWSRTDVQKFLYENARNSMRELQFGRAPADRFYNRHWPEWFDRKSDGLYPVVSNPESILLIVAGGAEGRFSAVVPNWGLPGSQTLSIYDACKGACEVTFPTGSNQE